MFEDALPNVILQSHSLKHIHEVLQGIVITRVLPMKKWVGIGFLACCSVIVGCDADRIAKLEKENADLKATVETRHAATAFDLQAKCAKDARVWFNENWAPDKDTILLNFTNHYSAKLNRCFILVESHYNSRLAWESWTNDMDLYDVYENSEYAQFGENHYTYWKPKYSTGDEVITCEVSGTKCKTGGEFNNLVGQYMND